MKQNRRDLIKSSIALTVLTVSKASAQITKKVGVVTTIALKKADEEFLCFKKGLESGGWTETAGAAKQVNLPNPNEALGKYGGTHSTTELENAINNHGQVDLIVAAGGVISREAAKKVLANSNIPYVYLSGMAPSTPLPTSSAGKFCGVILNTPARYVNARKALVSPADTGDVWLVQNFNSSMTTDEKAAWRAGFRSDRDFRFFEPPGASPIDNDEMKFAGEVAKLKMNNPKGVVVSPDAFFRMKHKEFTDAMTDANSGLSVPICYPFKDYPLRAMPTDQLLKGGAALSTPNTGNDVAVKSTAYGELGREAALMLDDPAPLRASTQWEWDDAAGTGKWNAVP